MPTTTSICTEAAVGARPRVHVTSGVLRAMVIGNDHGHARVALVAQTALLLAGDEVVIDVEVGRGTTLEVLEPSGTVAYDMRGRTASWHVRLQVHDDATLIWHGEPFVVANGASVSRTLVGTLGHNAVACMRETVVLGRTGEQPGHLTQRTRWSDTHGPLLVEDLTLSPDTAVSGMLGANRVVDTVTAFCTADLPDTARADRLSLERNGAVWRRLGTSAHTASLADVWSALPLRRQDVLNPATVP